MRRSGAEHEVRRHDPGFVRHVLEVAIPGEGHEDVGDGQ